MTERFTLFGASGFIGSALTAHLRAMGHQVATPARGTETAAVAKGDLGHVIYAIGLTAGFRQRPLDTVRAHVSLLTELIGNAHFQSWLYLSSTRVYARLPTDALASEDMALPATPNADELYNLSKMLGEAICLARSDPATRVARLSNVYGAGQGEQTFLASVMTELSDKGKVTIGEGANSSKDYIAIEDVCALLASIALSGRSRLYNVASGTVTTHQMIADNLTRTLEGEVCFAPNGQTRRFPRIDTTRIAEEFGFAPRVFATDLTALARRIADPVRTAP